MLEAQARDGVAGYNPVSDAKYRRIRKLFLEWMPREPSLKRHARQAARLLPPTLTAFIETGLAEWTSPVHGGRGQLVSFQGKLLTVLEAAGRAPTWDFDFKAPAAARRGARPAAAPARAPNRAQLRAGKRREQARALRAEGLAIKEIARLLGCSVRAVAYYLQDLQ